MNTSKIFIVLKKLKNTVIVLVVLFCFSCATQSTLSAQHEYISTQVFYDQLSPFGQWVDNPDYGFVWIPDVDQDFSPYSTSGYWVMTEYGWTWVSDYSWGWAPFHYGRWDFNDNYGWFWVPDNEWGPSWVTWRTGNGYYGWTPMRPGISISLSFGNDYRDIDHWNFVHEGDFGRPDMYRYYADRNEYNTIIINSTVINNTYVDRSRNTTYIAGPSRNDVQRVTGRKISNISVRDNARPGQALNNSQLQIYRPQIQKTRVGDRQPAPSRITNQKDVRPARESNNSGQPGKDIPTDNNKKEPQQSQPQRQIQDQRQPQPSQQPEKRNEQPQQQQQQQQNQRNQEQQQKERQKQQKQNQQINNKVDEQVKQQEIRTQQMVDRRKQAQQQQVEKQQQDQQRQVQQQQQKQEIRNQEQQVKQQKEQQRQVQKQAVQEQKQNRKTQQQQQRKQQVADPAGNKKVDRQPGSTEKRN